MTQTRFRPLHEDHAISEQMIFFQFAPSIDKLMPALIALKDEMKGEFPISESLKSVRVDFVENEPTRQEVQDAAGIVLSKPGTNVPQEWVLNITADTISIHCTVYTRWAEVWANHGRYIKQIFSKIPRSQVFLTCIGIKWLDQFIFEGKDEDYNTSGLLSDQSQYLSPSAFSSGPRWHCHTGWFEGPIADDCEVLNQLAVNAGQINLDGHLRTAVTVDHNQMLRADKRVDQLANLLPTTEEGFRALSDLMETLHSGNKRVLMDLLDDSMCERVGLKAEHRA